ncbi:MAG: hypothetical protein AB7U73_03655 [Pirellulales bacterium]
MTKLLGLGPLARYFVGDPQDDFELPDYELGNPPLAAETSAPPRTRERSHSG